MTGLERRHRGFEHAAGYESSGIPLPARRTALSAGYDLSAARDTEVERGKVTLVPTGVKAYMQPDEYLGIHIRSGIAVRYALALANGQGIIDADYYGNADNDGHILLALINHGPADVFIARGERVAQAIFYKYLRADGDAASGARAGGFGSTGPGGAGQEPESE